MKLNKIVLTLMIALVAMLATTGCKKGFNGKVTGLPGQTHGVGDNNPLTTVTPTPPVDFGQQPIGSTPGQLATSTTWDPSTMRQDRSALAEQTVHFAFDSAAVLSKEESKLIIVAEKLKSDPTVKLLIEGHCDERGTEEYNRSLGERRALALREALARAGVDPERIRTISYGKDKPADSGHDESAWSKNRRGEFVLCYPQGTL